ncbi:MAG: flagellar M-ring protein FliF C-terminal domain-containing protein, partial [Lachnospiraceae bacterium]
MPDKIKEILDKVLAWWNKFTTKQKTIIIAITAAVVFTFAILIYVFTRPQYVQWQQCDNTSEAAEVIEILEGSNIDYQTSTDGLSIKVKVEQLSVANLALGAAGYMPDDYSFEDYASGGSLSTTQSDRQKMWQHYLEQKLAKDITAIESVKSAAVTLHIPDQTGTLIASDEESSAWIQLVLYDKFTSEQAATVARAVATALGNRSTANITIVDSNANLLFSGEEDYSTAGVANSMLELRSQAEAMVGADVKKVLVGSKQFDMVEVACRLDIDFAEYQRTIHEYYANAGRDEGMYSHLETYEDSNSSGVSGIPGTDSNNETTYQFQDGTDTESSSSQTIIDYLPNEL